MLQITAYQGGEALGTGAYDQERVCIGSAADAHLQVEAPDIEPRHAEVWLQGGRCYGRGLGEAAVFVNGVELDGETTLMPQDRLRVGQSIEFSVKVGESPQKEADEPAPGGGAFSFRQAAEDDEPAPKPRAKPKPKARPEPVPAAKAEDEKKYSAADWGKLAAVVAAVGVVWWLFILPFGKQVYMAFFQGQ